MQGKSGQKKSMENIDNSLQVTEVKNISREIKPHTERMLWAVSAGVCEFRGCCNKLYTHHVTKENINLAEKAHIYAFSKGGKRPSMLRLTARINDIENLMLVCERCHKLIDSVDTDYSAEQLIEMKKEHEDRVAKLVSIKPDLQSEIIIYNANIAKRAIKISDFVAKSGIIPEHYPARLIPINFSPDLSLFDNDSNYWSVMEKHLEHQWYQFEPVLRDKHISLFAIAPQPLLFKLGMLVNRNYNVDVRQSQGSIDDWKWKSSKQTAQIQTIIISETAPSEDVIVTFELTAKLSEQELRQEFGSGTIYRITTSNCSPEIIKSHQDLRAVMDEYRMVLNKIRKSHQQKIKIKLVPIAPVSVSIEAGRQLMKGDPQVSIYDRNYITKEWTEALVLNGKEKSNV